MEHALRRRALVAVSEHGRRLAERVDGDLLDGSPRTAIEKAWLTSREIVFFGAAGIAVRLLAPMVSDKKTDPAVVVVDDAGRYAISLLSGHEGSANQLARDIARQLGAEAVVTTATEVLAKGDYVLGVGCSRGAGADEIESLARIALADAGASFESVAEVATIDLKSDEPGLLAFAERWHWPVRCFSAEELAVVKVANPSEIVRGAVGTPSVAQASATLAAASLGGVASVFGKHTSEHVTVAVAKVRRQCCLSIVGLGPGGREQLTFEALDALRTADVIVGYTLYTDMVQAWLPLAECVALPLGEELERARRAIGLARAGQRVALVSSGDAGIYALAGLVFEELGGDSAIQVEVVPGITAATSAAALLGAPLMADFAAISLSDLRMPAEVLRRRLRAAAEGDLVTVLYNPASQRRRQLLAEAQATFLEHRSPATPVGLVRNAYRPGQNVRIVRLDEMPLDDVDMFTVVVIGNSQTALVAGKMVTRRDYRP